MAQSHGVPVIPVGMNGTEAVQPIGKRLLRPFKKVRIVIGEPLFFDSAGSHSSVARGSSSAHESGQSPDGTGSFEDVDDEHAQLRSFTDHLMHEIARLSGSPYVDTYASRSKPAAPSPPQTRQAPRPASD